MRCVKSVDRHSEGSEIADLAFFFDRVARNNNREGTQMLKRFSPLAIVGLAVLSGCAGTVITNDGERVVLEHDMGVSIESVRSVALKACKQAGKANAEHVATTNKNPSFKKGFGAQISTFRCS